MTRPAKGHGTQTLLVYAALLRAGLSPAEAFTRTHPDPDAAARGAAVLSSRGTLPEALTASGACDASVTSALSALLSQAPARPDVLTAFTDAALAVEESRRTRSEAVAAWGAAAAVCATTAAIVVLVAGSNPAALALAPLAAAGAVGAGWWRRRTLTGAATAALAAHRALLAACLARHGAGFDDALATSGQVFELLGAGEAPAFDTVRHLFGAGGPAAVESWARRRAEEPRAGAEAGVAAGVVAAVVAVVVCLLLA